MVYYDLLGRLGKTPMKHQVFSDEFHTHSKHLLDMDMEPKLDAFKFYALNTEFDAIKTKFGMFGELPKDVVDFLETKAQSYYKIVDRISTYLLSICIREARYYKNTPSEALAVVNTNLKEHKTYGLMYDDVIAPHWLSVCDFLHDIKGTSKEVPQELFSQRHLDCMALFPAIELLFIYGSYGSSYGGLPWSKITRIVSEALLGLRSIESMVDAAWSMAHNTGSIFNKGIVYEGADKWLTIVLDVQHSGQIPSYARWLLHKGLPYSNSFLRLPATTVSDDWYYLESLGIPAPEPMDWSLLKDSGIKGTYSKDGDDCYGIHKQLHYLKESAEKAAAEKPVMTETQKKPKKYNFPCLSGIQMERNEQGELVELVE